MLRFCTCVIAVLFSVGFTQALAACSRPIMVAASPLGESMKIDQNLIVSGIVVDTLAKVEKATGCHFVYQVLPRVRALRMFDNGEIDLIAAAQLSARDAVGVFLPVLSLQNALITRKSRQTEISPMVRLQSGALMVNVVRGMNMGPAYTALLDDLRRQNKLEEVVDLDVVANKMAVNRADATIQSPLVFMLAAQTYGLENDLQVSLFSPKQISQAGFYLSKSKLSTLDGLLLKNALEKVIKSGDTWRMYQQSIPEWALFGVLPLGLKKSSH